MRPMVLEFPDDPAAATVDTQYMLGPDLLVAPVFTADGDVDVYLPEGTWTSLLTGDQVTGPRWVRERHGFDSVPAVRAARDRCWRRVPVPTGPTTTGPTASRCACSSLRRTPVGDHGPRRR